MRGSGGNDSPRWGLGRCPKFTLLFGPSNALADERETCHDGVIGVTTNNEYDI